jgi:hypothetical protein
MLLPRLQPPLRAALTSIGRSAAGGSQTACLNEAFTQLSIRAPYPGLIFVRHASHAQQGAVNKAKDGPGKRLGAKRSGGISFLPHPIPDYESKQMLMRFMDRTICHPRQHHLPPTRHALVPR